MLIKCLTILTTLLSRTWRVYISHWRVSIPASLGALVGLWFGGYLSQFGVDSHFSTPLGLPKIFFRLFVTICYAVGFAVIGRQKLDEWFPRQ